MSNLQERGENFTQDRALAVPAPKRRFATHQAWRETNTSLTFQSVIAVAWAFGNENFWVFGRLPNGWYVAARAINRAGEYRAPIFVKSRDRLMALVTKFSGYTNRDSDTLAYTIDRDGYTDAQIREFATDRAWRTTGVRGVNR